MSFSQADAPYEIFIPNRTQTIVGSVFSKSPKESLSHDHQKKNKRNRDIQNQSIRKDGPLKPSSITSTNTSLSTRSLLGVAQTTLLLPPTLQSASAVFVDRTGSSTQPGSLTNDSFYNVTPTTPSITPLLTPSATPFIYNQSIQQYAINESNPQNELNQSSSSYLLGLNSHLDSPIYPPHNVSTTKTDDRFTFPTFESLQAANVFPTFLNSQSSNPGKQFPLLEDIEMFLEDEKRSKSEERNTTPSSDYSSSSDELLIQDGEGRVPKRREKKKQQNREAATRYREKKRKERQEAKQKEDVLKQQNQVLKTKIGEIQTEIDYLKRLMHEIGMDDVHIKYISPVVPL